MTFWVNFDSGFMHFRPAPFFRVTLWKSKSNENLTWICFTVDELIENENKWMYTNVGYAYIISCLRQDGLGGMISTFSMFFTKTMFAPLSAQKHLPFEDLSCPGREMPYISLESISCRTSPYTYTCSEDMLNALDLWFSELKLTFHLYSHQAGEKNKSCSSLHCLLVVVEQCLCYVWVSEIMTEGLQEFI